MVKFFFVNLLLSLCLYGAQNSILDETIASIVGAQTYNANKVQLGSAFKHKDIYTDGERVDLVRVLKTLKEQKIIKLSLATPQVISVSFKTTSNAHFFIKIVSDALKNTGYLKTITKSALLDDTQFVWTLEYNSKTLIDPVALESELAKSKVHIKAVAIVALNTWNYEIDMSHAHLNVEKLLVGDNSNTEQMNSEKWIELSQVRQVAIISDATNSWYPFISFYDASLNLIKTEKIDKKTSYLTLDIPQEATYVKISDLYSITNIKNGLNIDAQE